MTTALAYCHLLELRDARSVRFQRAKRALLTAPQSHDGKAAAWAYVHAAPGRRSEALEALRQSEDWKNEGLRLLVVAFVTSRSDLEDARVSVDERQADIRRSEGRVAS